ncbi:MAG: FG-GAP-like repeat-containing protein, partial [Anaerolineae bacterium]
MALGDVDGDGDLDALVGTEEGAQVWTNQDGTFTLSEPEISGDQTRAVFLSDLDGDGDLDALVVGRR